jgi:large subunit ribosomal protein L20
MRVKRGIIKKQKHKKILKKAKGYRLSRSKIYKRAKEAVLHAGQYSYNHRRKRGNQFRKLWIQRIHAVLDSYDLSYSKFIHLLKQSKIELNRKVLSELAIHKPEVFETVVKKVTSK